MHYITHLANLTVPKETLESPLDLRRVRRLTLPPTVLSKLIVVLFDTKFQQRLISRRTSGRSTFGWHASAKAPGDTIRRTAQMHPDLTMRSRQNGFA